MTISGIRPAIPRFQGVETFNKRRERDKLFTEEPLPDFDKIRDKETRDLFIRQKDHAQYSKETLDQTAAGGYYMYRLFAESWIEHEIPKEAQQAVVANSLKDAGLTIDPNAAMEDKFKLLGQYNAHEHDESLQNNYGVGEQSDKAVKILKEWKENPGQSKLTERSLLQKITDFFKDCWTKLKKFFSS